MPELPEVETTKNGIKPHILDKNIGDIIVRQPKLRKPIPEDIKKNSVGKTIINVQRRGKYIIICLNHGYFIIHLGMSGFLRILAKNEAPKKHDHVDLCLTDETILRLNDPRRFGLWLYLDEDPLQSSYLNHYGPEPLLDDFSPHYLFGKAKGKKKPIKSFLMDNEVVVGVGNIYAVESLFKAKIHPKIEAGKLSFQDMDNLCYIIKDVIAKAITAGGTTFRDFKRVDGTPGYFAQQLNVYGRQGKVCNECDTLISNIVIGGRASPFCPQCQLIPS